MTDRLATLNTILGRRPYAAGDQLTLADLSIATSLSLPEAAKFDFSPYPNITAWLAKIKQLPYYDEAMKEGIEQLTSFLAAKGKE